MASPYETAIELRSFAGINQTGDGWELSPRFAVEAENVDTTGGGFAAARKGTQLSGTAPGPIGTLALLYRRFSFSDFAESKREVLIAAAGGKLYYRVLSGGSWVEIYSGLSTDYFDYVTYEVNNGVETEDVMLLSNAIDGMYCVYGSDMHVESKATPRKFAILARHAERIWGSGCIGEPDVLVYSAPFDPLNWEADVEDPANGAGEIMQPSWDGDSFEALRTFGDQLLAFKKNRVWRIVGTSPAEYRMYEQFGGGTIAENTVVVNDSSVFMLSSTGLKLFDGSSVVAFRQDMVRLIMDRVNFSVVGRACAAMWGRKYCLALPLDGSSINNAVLVLDTEEGSFNLLTGLNVKAFLTVNDRMYYTTDTTPGTVWLMGGGDALPVLWRSGKLTASGLDSTKSNFMAYLTVHVEGEAGLDLTLKVITERKTKEKTIHVAPGDKIRRLPIGNSGRWVQLELSTDTTLPWSLLGSLRVTMELDHD